jgi:hypothetical protein
VGWDEENIAVKETMEEEKKKRHEKEGNGRKGRTWGGENRVIREDKEKVGKWKKEKDHREKPKKGRHIGEIQSFSDTEGKTR